MQKLRDEDHFLGWGFVTKKIVFTDEYTFYLKGFINKQNNCFWTKENPNKIHERHHQVQLKINVWCGTACSRVMGPYFFGNTI